MKTKKKGYVLKVIVFGATTRLSAQNKVLYAFAQRQPDGCEFYVVGKTKAIKR